MKIVGFMPITNPIKGAYPYIEAIRSHLVFLDKLHIVDGGSTDGTLEELRREFDDEFMSGKLVLDYLYWPQGKGNWLWEEFSHHWNFGLQRCKNDSADWVCAAECDHVWPENEAIKVRKVIKEKGSGHVVMLADKLVSSTWDRFQSKSKFAYFLNLKENPNLGYGMDRNYKGGQDLANPILVIKEKGEFGIPEGVMVTGDMGKNMGLYFWNYDKTFKTKRQILDERKNANWAWNNCCLVKLGLMPQWEEVNVVEDVVSRMKSRWEKSPYYQPDINSHPVWMRERLSKIKKNMLGYSLFDEIKR